MHVQPPITAEVAPDQIFRVAGAQEEFDLVRQGLDLLAADPQVAMEDGSTRPFDPADIADLRDSLSTRVQLIPGAEARPSEGFINTHEISLDLPEASIAGAALATVFADRARTLGSPSSDNVAGLVSEKFVAGSNALRLLPGVLLGNAILQD